MAQITYRANLSAKTFPFISDNWGRSIIVPQYDNNFSRQLASAEDTDKDIGIPQAYYMHNVMPVAQGFQSIGYTPILNKAVGARDFLSITLIRDAADNKAYLGVTVDGKFYINRGAGWLYKASYPSSALITSAFVSGTQYIYIQSFGCVMYDFISEMFSPVTLTGLDPTKVIGITGAVGYLIAWSSPVSASSLLFDTTLDSPVLLGIVTDNLIINQPISGNGIPVGAYIIAIDPGVSITISAPAEATATITLTAAAQSAVVAWSSTVDPTDFAPSLITGAGGGSVEGARGAITLCVAHTLGFIVYTTNNAVAAVYSNNSRFPFTFREILSSGGVSSLDLVAFDTNTGNHYVYGTSGFQLVSTNQTQTLFPELTDFISGKLFEDYDETTKTFSRTVLSSTMAKKISVISDRYLIVSYGIDSLTHALVFDTAEKRWGKLKIPHIAVIEYQLPAPGIFEIPKQSIGFLQIDGALKTVDFGAFSIDSLGVIALGKFQFVRARTMQLDTFAIENVRRPETFTCQLLTSIDGKNQFATSPVILGDYTSGELITYGVRATGINHSIVFTGNFYLESLILQFNIHGKR